MLDVHNSIHTHIHIHAFMIYDYQVGFIPGMKG